MSVNASNIFPTMYYLPLAPLKVRLAAAANATLIIDAGPDWHEAVTSPSLPALIAECRRGWWRLCSSFVSAA